MNDTQQATSWLSQQHEKTAAIKNAYNQIQAAPPDKPHRTRQPNSHEQNAADGHRYPDKPTHKNRRLPTEIDPTGDTILKWEAACQQAATLIADTAAHLHGHATTAAVRPHTATPRPLPLLPVVRTTNTGHVQLDVHPDDLGRYVNLALHWITATTIDLAANIANAADQGEAAHVARRLTTLASHLGVRLCRCEDRCGLPAPQPGSGATRPNCRKKKQRRNNGRDGNDATLANQPRHRGHNGQEAHPGSTPGTSTSSRVPASREPRRSTSPVPSPAAPS